MNSYDPNEQDIFKTGISISTSESWLSSILRQIRERKADKQADRPELTAEPDPSVLDKFVQTRSPFSSLLWTIRDIRADKLRTFTPTATPLEVEEIWSKDNSGYSGLISVGLHVLLVVILVIPAFVILQPAPTPTQVVMLTPPLILNLPPAEGKSGGGGGGGLKTPTPPSKGQLPRAADKQIVPPMVEAKNLLPDLIAEPTVVAPQLSNLVPLPFEPLGDPNGVVGPPSAGPGTGGGIGTGTGTGVGSGKGPGVGPGEGGGIGGGAFSVGGGVSEPILVSRSQPEYSDDGRKARIQGTVELLIIVESDGSVRFDSVRKSLGYGLDQKAIEAVKKWRFIAGKKDGRAVPTYVSVLVNFSLR